jgi:hypothetical protein
MSSSSFTRWLWVAPLTVVVALAANFVIRSIAVALDPGLSRSGQLQGVYVGLTLMGSVAAMLILGLLVLTVARPLFWFRIVAIGALLVSWIPDIGLAMGGRLMLTSMQVMGHLSAWPGGCWAARREDRLASGQADHPLRRSIWSRRSCSCT